MGNNQVDASEEHETALGPVSVWLSTVNREYAELTVENQTPNTGLWNPSPIYPLLSYKATVMTIVTSNIVPPSETSLFYIFNILYVWLDATMSIYI